MTSENELLPLPDGNRACDMSWDAQVYDRYEMRDYTRANMGPLLRERDSLRNRLEDAVRDMTDAKAENERLRAEVETGDTNLAAAMSAVAELEARAERLAKALRGIEKELGSELVVVAGGRVYLPERAFRKALHDVRAALAQEDRA